MSEIIVDVGTCVKLKAIFRDPVTKELVEPGVVVATVRAPEAPPADNQTPEVEELDKGEYQVEVIASRAGRWYVAFDASGGGYTGAKEASFVARERYVPR